MSHLEAMDIEGGFVAKIDALVNCYTHNRFPAQVYTDMQRFYPRQWDKLTEVKKFNQDLLSALITEAAGNGEIRPGITPEILEILVEKIIEIVVDNNYLIPQHLTLQQAFHELRNIILYGILNNNQSGEEDVREK
jgi:pyruvate/2-oxoacid:ferredoxin oxidoreductase beta subunit